jgi:hypothetical protein
MTGVAAMAAGISTITACIAVPIIITTITVWAVSPSSW